MENQENLRAYFFCNMYLGGIQAGIQSQHATAEMFMKYEGVFRSHQKSLLLEWGAYHKTSILLNGGMAGDLQNVIDHLNVEYENAYPWASFNESIDALNNALTNVCIVLPESIYNFNKLSEEEQALQGLTTWELQLVDILSSKSLMK